MDKFIELSCSNWSPATRTTLQFLKHTKYMVTGLVRHTRFAFAHFSILIFCQFLLTLAILNSFWSLGSMISHLSVIFLILFSPQLFLILIAMSS